jgi:2-polyprenyl-3-methyl-5-hydroxy-6-metoxy-1,4-benzoquinol methylase
MQSALNVEADPLRCIVCRTETARAQAKSARIRSNVKRFSHETFEVWQCPSCASVHAAAEVDLAFYYAHYPFHSQRISAGTRLMFASKLRELEKLGLKRTHRVLDYGCGGGAFVHFLRERGYSQARGYDAYVSEGEMSEPPGSDYDVLLSQDVLEHVDDPREHLETLKGLCVRGGLLVLGTPNAAAIDLQQPEEYIHVLHQPYHRHIVTADALTAMARAIGLELLKVKPGFFGNRAIPGMNGRYMRRMLRLQGDTIDDLLAGKTPLHWRLFTPAAVWDALTGSFRDEGYDMLVAFRLPHRA